MSRSRRRNPFITEKQSASDGKLRKRRANRAVRRTQDIESGGSYKKLSESWDINDYSFYVPDERKARNK